MRNFPANFWGARLLSRLDFKPKNTFKDASWLAWRFPDGRRDFFFSHPVVLLHCPKMYFLSVRFLFLSKPKHVFLVPFAETLELEVRFRTEAVGFLSKTCNHGLGCPDQEKLR